MSASSRRSRHLHNGPNPRALGLSRSAALFDAAFRSGRCGTFTAVDRNAPPLRLLLVDRHRQMLVQAAGATGDDNWISTRGARITMSLPRDRPFTQKLREFAEAEAHRTLDESDEPVGGFNFAVSFSDEA